MKRIQYLILSTALLLCMRLPAQVTSSLLYEMEDPKSGLKSYLFGTMHDSRRSIFNFNDSIFYAIDQTQKAVFELELDGVETNSFSSAIQESKIKEKSLELLNIMMTDVMDSLMLHFTPNELAKRLEALVMNMVDPIQSIMKQMASNENQFYIDKFYMNYAKQSNKEIGSLETFDQQIRALTKDLLEIDLNEAKMGSFFVSLLKDPDVVLNFTDMISMNSRLADHYAQGDLNAICNLISSLRFQSKDNLLSERFYHSMFDERNVLMAEKAIAMSREYPVFIAVGAGHLCGETGLIEAFKRAGYKVRPVNITARVPMSIEWTAYETHAYSIMLPKNVSPNDLVINSQKAGWTPLGDFFINEMGFMAGKPFEVAYMYTPKGVVALAIEEERDLFNEDELEEYHMGMDVIPPPPPPPPHPTPIKPPPSNNTPDQHVIDSDEDLDDESAEASHPSHEVEVVEEGADGSVINQMPSMNNVMELIQARPERLEYIMEFSEQLDWNALSTRLYTQILMKNFASDQGVLALPDSYGLNPHGNNAQNLEFDLNKAGGHYVVSTVVENKEEDKAYRLYIYGDYEAVIDPSLLPFFYKFKIK